MYSNVEYSYHEGIPKKYYHLKNKKFSEWEIPPWELKINGSECLGQGSFGEVYKATWRHTPVISKIAHENISDVNKSLFIREFDSMTKMHHPNIVQLFGFVKEPFIIVMEHVLMGDLKSYMLNKNLSINNKIDISIDILRGLNYMHNRKPEKLIHRDIKLGNLLITMSGRVKIADFGLAKCIYDENLDLKKLSSDDLVSLYDNGNLTNNVGTFKYMAPEIIIGSYDEKVDIWSAGVVLYELFTNKELLINDFEKYFEKIRTNQLYNTFKKENIPSNIYLYLHTHFFVLNANERSQAMTILESIVDLYTNENHKYCGCLPH